MKARIAKYDKANAAYAAIANQLSRQHNFSLGGSLCIFRYTIKEGRAMFRERLVWANVLLPKEYTSFKPFVPKENLDTTLENGSYSKSPPGKRPVYEVSVVEGNTLFVAMYKNFGDSRTSVLAFLAAMLKATAEATLAA